MAFLQQRKNTWYVVFSLPGDRKKWVKIGKCTKSEAKRVLAKLESEIIAGNFGILNIKPISFEDFARIYLERIKSFKAEKTWNTEKGFIQRQLIPYFGSKRLSTITKQDVEEYVSRRSKQVKGNTIRLEVLCLSSMLRKAVEWGYLAKLPWDKIPLPKVRDAKEVRFLSVEEVQRLKQCSSPWLYPFVCLALHTGMRLNEMLWLEWNQIDFERRVIRLYNKPGFTLKNLQTREIPMDDELYQVLWNHWLYYPKPNASKPDKDAYLPRADHQKRWVFCHPKWWAGKEYKNYF